MRRACLLGLILLGVTVGVYFRALDAYFVADDFTFTRLYRGQPLLGYLALFTTPWADNAFGFVLDELRPFSALAFELNSRVSVAPASYHAFNLILHAVNALLVAAIARRAAGLGWRAAGAASVIFAVLPCHVEAVAWIQGRTDLVFAFFYLATFLAYAQWRNRGSNWYYLAAVAGCFGALFSKQSAITVTGTLALYDLLIAREDLSGVNIVRRLWRIGLRCIPFAVLTAGYLLLRLRLLGVAAREDKLGGASLLEFVRRQLDYLQEMVLGSDAFRVSSIVGLRPDGVGWGGVAVLLPAIALILLLATNAGRATLRGYVSRLLYFGPVWWVLSTLPIIAAGYTNSRFLYCACAGFAILVVMLLSALAESWPQGRSLVAATAVAVAVCYAIKLQPAVEAWRAAGDLSQKIEHDVVQQALALPQGSLVVLDVTPGIRRREIPARLWSWALPYAMRPPFAPVDLTQRVGFVAASRVYCCRGQWFDDMHAVLHAWRSANPASPVALLAWDQDGNLSVHTDIQDPALRRAAEALEEAPSPAELHDRLRTLVSSRYR